MAGLLGAAMGLCEAPSAFEHLAGRVVFFAVPAEEYGDVEWRVSRRGRGGSSSWAASPSCCASATSTTWTSP